MANERSAVDTIRGYYYQFDYYILEILERESLDDILTIEAIEDVDIYSQNICKAVQCKYYEKTEYNHSVISKPIRMMLKDFKDNENQRHLRNYKIYGYYSSGQNKLKLPITLDFLKSKFLTFTKTKQLHKYYEELDLSDKELLLFISHLEIDINASRFDVQEAKIISKLKELFNCSEFDAEICYYNNALRLVRSLATSQDVNKRTISKKDFIKRINTKEVLFDRWYLEYRGIREYCKLIKNQYFSQYNISPYERFFLIDCDASISEQNIKRLILKISKKWSKLSKKEPKPFCPYVYLHGLSERTVINIKKSLQNDGVIFSDGYDFKGSDFFVRSIVRKATFHNDIKLKLITELGDLGRALEELTTKRVIYQFYIDTPFYECDLYEHNLIKINTSNDIENII